MSRKTPRPNPISVYLGSGDKRTVRKQRLDELLKPYGGVSEFMQKLADGDFDIKPKSQVAERRAG